VNEFNVGATVPVLLSLHHAALLVLVLWLNLAVPGWMLDAPFWFNSVSGIMFPTSAMQSWEIDTAQTSATDKVLFALQAHPDIKYAAVIRTCLSLSSGVGIKESLMKWSYAAWCASILASFALRPFLTKEATAIKLTIWWGCFSSRRAST
jgi:hypothetical protein